MAALYFDLARLCPACIRSGSILIFGPTNNHVNNYRFYILVECVRNRSAHSGTHHEASARAWYVELAGLSALASGPLSFLVLPALIRINRVDPLFARDAERETTFVTVSLLTTLFATHVLRAGARRSGPGNEAAAATI